MLLIQFFTCLDLSNIKVFSSLRTRLCFHCYLLSLVKYLAFSGIYVILYFAFSPDFLLLGTVTCEFL